MTGDKRPRKPNSNNTPRCPTTGKYAHKNEERAKKMALRLNSQKAKGRTEQYPFKCPHCRWWHLALRLRPGMSKEEREG